MKHLRTIRVTCCFWLIAAVASLNFQHVQAAEGDFHVYRPVPTEYVRNAMIDQVDKSSLPVKIRHQLVEKWSTLPAFSSPLQVMEALVATVEQFDTRWNDLIDATHDSGRYFQFEEMQENLLSTLNPTLRSNMELYLGSQLSSAQMYDEAITVLGSASVNELVDPASYFFHKAVCEHNLLMKQDGLTSLGHLLERTDAVPVRYSQVAELMKYDLENLEEKSLDEVARMMSDVERRLELGRAGSRVQKLEKEIVSRLDEMIEKIEQSQNGGGGGGSGNSNDPGNQPLQDSIVKGSTAPGNVDNKDIGHKDGWGNLPEKDQAKAKQILGSMYPAHYGKAIEEYSRKSAERTTP
ncbi:hypothetical protein [Lacunimicrobium album]